MAYLLQNRKNVSLLKVTEFCSDVHGILVRNSSEAQSDTQPQPSMNVSIPSVDSALGQYIYHYIPHNIISKLPHMDEAINNTSRQCCVPVRSQYVGRVPVLRGDEYALGVTAGRWGIRRGMVLKVDRHSAYRVPYEEEQYQKSECRGAW
jgi:hypothetical protein